MNQIARFYVGTYSRPLIFGTGEVFEGKGKGIHTYLFDIEKGTLMEEGAPTETANPSFVSLSADKELLYAVNELTTFQGKKGGALNTYRRAEKGVLTLISQKTTGGEDPCHVVTDRERKMVLVSNYSGGSLAVWPLDKDGAPVGEAQVIQHTGKGRNPARQEGPHVHSITLTRDEKFAVTADLGLDELVLYPVDKKQGRLKEAEKIIFPTGEETGPRLILFNRKGDRCYVACELSCEVLVLSYENGNFTLLQTLSTLKNGWSPENTAADIHLSKDEKFLYVSSRGEDTIAVYQVQEDGLLSLVEIVPAGVKTPRNFAIDPSGKWLLAGGQNSDTVAVHAVDPETGKLTLTGTFEVPTPVCLCFEP